MALKAVDDMWVSGRTVVLGIVGAPLTGRTAFCERLLSIVSERYGTSFERFDAGACERGVLTACECSIFIDSAGLDPSILDLAADTAGKHGEMVIYTALKPVSGRTVEIGWYDDADARIAFRGMCRHLSALGVTDRELNSLPCREELHDPALVSVLSQRLNAMDFRDKASFLGSVEDWRGILCEQFPDMDLFSLIDELDMSLGRICGFDADETSAAVTILDTLAFNRSEKPTTKPVMDLICGRDSEELLLRLEDMNLLELDFSRDPDVRFTCRMTPFMGELRLSRIRLDHDRWIGLLGTLYRAITSIDYEGRCSDTSWRAKNFRMNNRLMFHLVLRMIDEYRSDPKGFDDIILDGISYRNPGPREMVELEKAGISASGSGYIYASPLGKSIIVPSGDIPTYGEFVRNGGDPECRTLGHSHDAILLYSVFLFRNDIIDGAGSYGTEITLSIYGYLAERYGRSLDAPLARFSARVLSQGVGIADRGDEDPTYIINTLRSVCSQLEVMMKNRMGGGMESFLDEQARMEGDVAILAALFSRPDLRMGLDVDQAYRRIVERFYDMLYLNDAVVGDAPDPDGHFDHTIARGSIRLGADILSSDCVTPIPYMEDVSLYGFARTLDALLNKVYGMYLMETDPTRGAVVLHSSVGSYYEACSNLGRLSASALYCKCRTLQYMLDDFGEWDRSRNSRLRETTLSEAEMDCNRALKEAEEAKIPRIIHDLRLKMARILILKGNYQEALANIDQAVGSYPLHDYRNDEAMGDLMVSMGRMAEAVRHYNDALDGFDSLYRPWDGMVIRSKLYRIYATGNVNIPEELATDLGTYCASDLAKRMSTSFRKIRGNMTCEGLDGFFL